MWFWQLKQWFATTLALIVCLLLGAVIRGANTFRLSALDGERTYYLHALSSGALIKSTLGLQDILFVRGESVEFVLTDDSRTPLECANAVAKLFDAEILWQEQAGGTHSFYCFTPKWETGAVVCGRAVNLHVAVRGNRCVVGTPMIFGGF